MQTLYKRDTKGNVRIWRMEQDGDRYRTISGLQYGQQVTTEWTIAEPKNVGRSNATTGEAQAALEIEAQYALKLRKDYHYTLEAIDTEKYYKPMLAKDYTKELKRLNFAQGVYVQPKLDGIRCIAKKDGLWSRTGKPILAVPHIHAALMPWFDEDPTLVLDGELYNHGLKDNFNEIVSMVRKHDPTPLELLQAEMLVEYHVYDIASSPYMFGRRIEDLLHLELGGPKACIQTVSTLYAATETKVDEIYALFCQQGYEGGIIRLNGPYEQKRSSQLLKRKDFDDAEFTCVSIEEGRGNWSGVAKVVHCALPDGRTFKATVQGSKEYTKHVLDNAASYVGKQVTVQYFALTPDGVPRFPIAKRLHEDARW